MRHLISAFLCGCFTALVIQQIQHGSISLFEFVAGAALIGVTGYEAWQDYRECIAGARSDAYYMGRFDEQYKRPTRNNP